MQFQPIWSASFSKFSGGACSQTPPSGRKILPRRCAASPNFCILPGTYSYFGLDPRLNMMLAKMFSFTFYLKTDRPEIVLHGFQTQIIQFCLLPDFLYLVWIESYPHMNTNVEISCSNRNIFGIIKFIKILAEKSNYRGLKSL